MDIQDKVSYEKPALIRVANLREITFDDCGWSSSVPNNDDECDDDD